MLVLYKEDLIIISLNINLFLPWCSWRIAELVLNNNHSLKPAMWKWHWSHNKVHHMMHTITWPSRTCHIIHIITWQNMKCYIVW